MLLFYHFLSFTLVYCLVHIDNWSFAMSYIWHAFVQCKKLIEFHHVLHFRSLICRKLQCVCIHVLCAFITDVQYFVVFTCCIVNYRLMCIVVTVNDLLKFVLYFQYLNSSNRSTNFTCFRVSPGHFLTQTCSEWGLQIKNNKKASGRTARREFQAGLRGDVGL